MRVHPAVATALVLIGGYFLALPIQDWLRQSSRLSRDDGASPLLLVSFLSGALGLIFIVTGVVFSMVGPPDGSGRE